MSEDQTVRPRNRAVLQRRQRRQPVSRVVDLSVAAPPQARPWQRASPSGRPPPPPRPAGCAQSLYQDDGPELIIGTLGEASTINPFLANDSEADVRSKWLYDEFVGVAVDTFLPTQGLGLAADWTLDNLTYVFTIQENAKFSDGTDVTADDVAFTIKGMLAA